jgi:hypothetical protein
MNLQEVFKKIEMALTSKEEVKVEMANMKLADGTMLEAEAFEAGQNVFLVGEDDEKVAAPVGEHSLEDGRVLVIVEEGVIAEIREVEEEEAPAAEEPAQEEMAEEEQEVVMEYVTKEEFESAVTEIKEMIAGMMPKEEEMASEEVIEEVTEESKVEMSADELPAGKKVAAAPVEKKVEMHKFANKGRKDALARVMEKLS